MKNNQAFSIYILNGLYEWEGLGRYEDYCSEDGFETEAEAILDAIFFLESLDA
jgi:hypothetical protein